MLYDRRVARSDNSLASIAEVRASYNATTEKSNGTRATMNHLKFRHTHKGLRPTRFETRSFFDSGHPCGNPLGGTKVSRDIAFPFHPALIIYRVTIGIEQLDVLRLRW